MLVLTENGIKIMEVSKEIESDFKRLKEIEGAFKEVANNNSKSKDYDKDTDIELLKLKKERESLEKDLYSKINDAYNILKTEYPELEIMERSFELKCKTNILNAYEELKQYINNSKQLS